MAKRIRFDGRPGACRYGAHAMEFSINQPAERRARTTGIEPAPTALETVVLPLNYVPEEIKNRPSGFPEGGSWQSPDGVTQEPARCRGHTRCRGRRSGTT